MLVSSITILDAKIDQTLSRASVTKLDAIGRSVGRDIDSAVGSTVGRAMCSAVGRDVCSAMGRAIGRAMFSSTPFVRISAISVTRLDAKVKQTFLFTPVTRLDYIGSAVISSAPFLLRVYVITSNNQVWEVFEHLFTLSQPDKRIVN